MAPFDTEWPADSVEFCPTPGLENILVCGTYNLDASEDTSPSLGSNENRSLAPKAQSRHGKCLVFDTTAEDKSGNTAVKKTQEIAFAAIPDIKWCHRQASEPATAAIADSEGNITLLQWSHDEDCLKKRQTVSCASSDVLCLSLDWSNRRELACSLGSLVVSLSNGEVAILRSDTSNTLAISESWHAHEFEPWIAAWDYWNTNVVYSGGDDLKMKGWDCRQGFGSPIFVNKRFDAGVTTIQSHPFVEHLIAVGSYDNSVRLFDTRKPQFPISQADVGGGAWRVKWHPSPTRRNDLLVACMHDGFKVVRFNGVGQLLESVPSMEKDHAIINRFNEHASLAYGVDWSHADTGRTDTLIASCSFYDHTLNVWHS